MSSLFSVDRCLRFACLLMIAIPLRASGQQYRFDLYQQANGLRNLSVQDIAFDKSGFLWIATQNGLFRFLGSSFERYGPEEGLRERNVYQVYVDPRGRIWAGTYENLYRWNGSRFQPLGGPRMRFAAGHSLLAMGKDRLLVNNLHHLVEITLSSTGDFVSSRPFFSAAQVKSEAGLNAATGMAAGPDGTIWFGCGARLCSWYEGHLQVWGTEHGVKDAEWLTLHVDRRGSLWAASKSYLLELPSGSASFHDRSPPKIGQGQLFYWSPILEDRRGRILVASTGGLARREGNSWQLIGVPNGLKTERVTSLALDANGDPWVGTAGTGLAHWTGYEHWEAWTEAEGLPSSVIWSVNAQDPDRLIIGTRDGPWLFDRSRRAINKLTPSHTWQYGQVGNIATDRQSIWLSSFEGSVVRVQRNTYAVRKIAQLKPFLGRLIFSNDGRLWFLSARGIDSIDNPEKSVAVHHASEPDNLPGLSPDIISAASGCGSDRSLVFLRPYDVLLYSAGVWSRPPIAGIDSAAGQFREVSCATDGSIWIVGEDKTRHTLVWHLTAVGNSLHASRLALPESIQALVAYSILSDHRGWLWVGTDNGLAGWNGSSWRLFTREGGLIWNDTNRGALSEDADGSIWVGTGAGAAHLLEADRAFDRPALTVEITAVRRGAAGLPLYPAPTLSWAGDSLHFQFASPSVWNRSELSFSYRLVGLDSSWNSTQEKEVTYSRLPPGKYRFEISAKNSASGLTSDLADASFRILAPWWKTVWFYCFCTAGAGFLIWLMLWWRTRQLLLKKQRLELLVQQMTIETNRLAERAQDAALAEERNRLAHELHDTLAGAFTGIFSQLQAASDLAYTEETRRLACISRAEELARGGLRQVREFAHTLTISGEDHRFIVEMIRQLVGAMTDGTETLGSFAVEGIERPLKAVCAHALLRIAQEALANAQRYAKAGEIRVMLRFELQAVELEVIDNGRGFIVNETGEGGFGITGMRSRILRLGGTCSIESSPRSGTRISAGLPQPYEKES